MSEKILIAVPCMDQIATVFAESLLNLMKPEGTKACFQKSSLIYDSRNLISITAIQNKFDYVMWLDSDMQFPPDLLTKLLVHARNGEDFVTGLYFRRHFPFEPVIFSSIGEPTTVNGRLVGQTQHCEDYPENDTFYIQACGFGACLTSVKLLKDVWDNFGPAFAPFSWAGEDLSFCHRANQLGYKILCDSSIPIGHVGQAIFTEDMYKRNRGDANEDS